MKFWGVKVKSGQTLDVKVGKGKFLHLLQACLGKFKKGAKDYVCLHINVDEKKLVLGTLHTEMLPQDIFDLVIGKDFQLLHNFKNHSVYLYGYIEHQPPIKYEYPF